MNKPSFTIKELKPALSAIEVEDDLALEHALTGRPKLDECCVGKTRWTAGHFLARAAMARMRKRTRASQPLKNLLKVLYAHGTNPESLCKGFGEIVLEPSNRCEEKTVLEIAQWIDAEVMSAAPEVQQWSGQTLADLFKTAVWKKWNVAAASSRKGKLTPDCVRTLVQLGATPQSYPPHWHKEQNPVGFYAVELGNPQLSSALFAPARKQRNTGRRAGSGSKTATHHDMKRIEEWLAKSDVALLSGIEKGENGPSEALERIKSAMGHRFVPKTRLIDLRDVDRTRSMLGGSPFTSRTYPWPETDGSPHAPMAQLDLAEISRVAGRELGDGILQVWRALADGMVQSKASTLQIRVIPRGALVETKHITAPPETYSQCVNDPSYSWAQSPMKAPRYVVGWSEAGFAVPDLSALGDISSVPQDLVRLTGMVPRPELGIGLFDCPRLDGPYLDRAHGWRALATIYGPLYGCQLRSWGAFRDCVEVYFHERDTGEIEFQANWVGPWDE